LKVVGVPLDDKNSLVLVRHLPAIPKGTQTRHSQADGSGAPHQAQSEEAVPRSIVPTLAISARSVGDLSDF
jgi:hypothetical protein